MTRLISLILLGMCLVSADAIAQQIFLESRSTLSGRTAIFDDDGKVAYLYLTKPQSMQPERDAIVYSRVNPASGEEWQAAAKQRGAPPLPRKLASANGVLLNPSQREFSILWSADGNAAAILRDGVPLAFASSGERFGYSKAVMKSSPLVNLWDQARYQALFAAGPAPR
jgi:hypothetical protein